MSGQQSGKTGSTTRPDEFGASGATGTPSAAAYGTQSGGADVQDVKEAAKQTAQETKDTAMETAQQIKGDVQAQASEIAGDAKQQAGEMIGQAKEQATSAVATQQKQAVSGLGGLSDALRQTAKQMKEKDDGAQAGIAQFVEDAADRLAQSADFLRDKEPSELLHDVQDFAKKQPLLFAGAALGVGIVAARMLKGGGMQQAMGSVSEQATQAMGAVSEQATQAMDSVKERASDMKDAAQGSEKSGAASQAGKPSSPGQTSPATPGSGGSGGTMAGALSSPAATAGYSPDIPAKGRTS